MSLKTSNLPFKARVDHEVHNTIMRKAVVKAKKLLGLIVKKWWTN